MGLSEEEGEGLQILDVKRQVVFEDVEGLCYLVLPYQTLYVNFKILGQELLLLLIVSATLQNFANILVDGSWLLYLGLVPKDLCGLGKAQRL